MIYLLFVLCFICLLIVIALLFSYREKITILSSLLSNVDSTIEEIRKESTIKGTKIVELSSDLGKSKESLSKLEVWAKSAVEERDRLGELYKKERGRSKSIEVRTGQIMEKMVPLLDVFGGDHENASFLGQPIDYILWNDDAVVFIEVKTGGAQLSTKQRHIRDLIKEKKVEWREIRIKPEEEPVTVGG